MSNLDLAWELFKMSPTKITLAMLMDRMPTDTIRQHINHMRVQASKEMQERGHSPHQPYGAEVKTKYNREKS